MTSPAPFTGGPTGRGNFRFTSYFREVLSALDGAQERAAELTAQWAEDYAKQNAPVATGALRDSITASVRRTLTSFAIVVMAGASYALYVELGTSRMNAQPFMRPALDRIVDVYRAYLAAEVSGVH